MKKNRTRQVIKGEIIITNADNRSIFNKYLNEVSKYNKLTKDQEVELFKRLKDNDNSVIDVIIKHNLRFVIMVAKKYQDVALATSLTLEDMICEGNIGLCMAIKKYDYTRGYKFISFAVFFIKRQIIFYIANNMKNIRIPKNKVSLLKKIKELESDLEQSYGREINEMELLETAKLNGLFRDEYDNLFLFDLKNDGIGERSLNNSVSSYNDICLGDTIEDKNNEDIHDIIENKELIKFINDKLLNDLPHNIRRTFELYFGLNGEYSRDMKYIGKVLDINEATVNHRIKTYLWKLRKKYKMDFNKLELNLKDPSIVECGVMHDY